jgi:SAM-dependent methyltransferase
MQPTDLVALALVAFAAACAMFDESLRQALGPGSLAAHWVERAPTIATLTAAVVALGTRAAARAAATLPLTPARSDLERYARVFALSFSGLLLELALIRWVGAEVRAFAYFKNFVLIAVFLGFGIGFAVGPRERRLFPASLVGIVATTLLVAIWNDASLYPALAAQEQTWGHETAPRPAGMAFVMLVFLISLGAFFYALCGTFAALTQEMGLLFTELPRVRAYAVNLGGSLAGVLAFNALAWAETTPPVWFAVGLAPLAVLVDGLGLRALWGAATVVTIAVAGGVDARETGRDLSHAWSPYYRVSAGPFEMPLPGGMPSAARYAVSTNRELMTIASQLDAEVYAAEHRRPLPISTYDIPFLLKPDARRVLVLAVGLGNDVAAALRVGRPEKVVGVELDPCIARYARLLHPERPLADPRVELVVDDGRHHLQTTDERYDLVLMSMLDSHTLLSGYTPLRTDNYLYTRECFASARRVLAPGGVFVCTYASTRPWLAARLTAAIRAAFDGPLLVAGGTNTFCATGPGLPSMDALHPVVATFVRQNPMPLPPPQQSYPTDDRPFLTLADDGLPTAYWLSIVFLLAFADLGLRVAGLPLARIDLLFLALGAAFLLAETRLITLAGLLFGVTWQAYGVTIALVLSMLIVGTLVGGRLRPSWGPGVYVALLLSIAAGCFVPVDAIAGTSHAVRVGLTLLVFGPTFLLASAAFASELTRVPAAALPAAMASNLLGSVAGGLLEYQSVLAGVSSLAYTALALYAVAALVSFRRGR